MDLLVLWGKLGWGNLLPPELHVRCRENGWIRCLLVLGNSNVVRKSRLTRWNFFLRMLPRMSTVLCFVKMVIRPLSVLLSLWLIVSLRMIVCVFRTRRGKWEFVRRIRMVLVIIVFRLFRKGSPFRRMFLGSMSFRRMFTWMFGGNGRTCVGFTTIRNTWKWLLYGKQNRRVIRRTKQTLLFLSWKKRLCRKNVGNVFVMVFGLGNRLLKRPLRRRKWTRLVRGFNRGNRYGWFTSRNVRMFLLLCGRSYRWERTRNLRKPRDVRWTTLLNRIVIFGNPLSRRNVLIRRNSRKRNMVFFPRMLVFGGRRWLVVRIVPNIV